MCKPGLEIPSCLLRHRAEPAALHGSKPKSCEQNVLPPWATCSSFSWAGGPPFLLFGSSREKNSQTDLWRNVEFDGRKYKEELSKFEEVEFDLNYHLSIFLPFCKLKSSSP